MMTVPHNLIDGYLDGSLTDGQFAELVAWLNADSANAAEFARASADHSCLRDLWCGEDVREFFDGSQTDGLELLMESSDRSDSSWPVSPGAIAELLEESEAAFQRQRKAALVEEAAARPRSPAFKRQRSEHVPRPQPIEIPWTVVYAVAAAALLGFAQLLHGVWSSWNRDDGANERGAAVIAHVAPTATIVDSIDASWNIPTDPTRPGTPLSVGEHSLANGIVELELEGGARVVVEAPADFELLSADRIRLLDGKLVSNVPAEAIGFTVETSTAKVVDLGTEFGVIAENGGPSQVHVLDGVVELVAGDFEQAGDELSRSRLTAGSAVEVDEQGQITELAVKANAFFRKVPEIVNVERTMRASSDVRLVDLDGDQRGDRLDHLDQPPPKSENANPSLLVQSGVGVGEKNERELADSDARRYCLNFDANDQFNKGLPSPQRVVSVKLAYAIAERTNVGRLTADLYGIHDQQALAAGAGCFEAPGELLLRGAAHGRTRTHTEQQVDVTSFVKEQLRKGKRNLIFRFQIGGGVVPNSDGVRNVYVFHTIHSKLDHLAPKLIFTMREYTHKAN